VIIVAEATKGILKGSTLSVGPGRVRVTLAADVAAKTVIVEVRDRQGIVTRTLTLRPNKNKEGTLFLPAGRYSLSVSAGKGTPWVSRTLNVPR